MRHVVGPFLMGGGAAGHVRQVRMSIDKGLEMDSSLVTYIMQW